MGFMVFIAYVVDLLVGDPRFIPHPVVLIGSSISFLESVTRQFIHNSRGLKYAGIAVVAIIVGGAYGLTVLLLYLLAMIHPILAWLAGIWIISTTMAVRGLSQVAYNIRTLLATGDLQNARHQVGMIVGRDSDNMTSNDISRATVETVAENTVDAVVAPMIYAFVLGPPGAMAYRAANTLDSMLGYKNNKYMHLGWASARFDDLVNYIPARVTGLLMLVAVWVTGRHFRGGVRILLRDAHKHPSPNSGLPEAVVAGALGIRLGGLNYYGGQASFRAYLGGENGEVQVHHIRSTVDLMYATSFLTAVTGCFMYMFI